MGDPIGRFRPAVIFWSFKLQENYQEPLRDYVDQLA